MINEGRAEPRTHSWPAPACMTSRSLSPPKTFFTPGGAELYFSINKTPVLKSDVWKVGSTRECIGSSVRCGVVTCHKVWYIASSRALRQPAF